MLNVNGIKFWVDVGCIYDVSITLATTNFALHTATVGGGWIIRGACGYLGFY